MRNLLTAFLLALPCWAFAQTDTTQADAINPRQRPDPTLPSASQPSLPPPDGYRSVNPMIRIRLDDAPSGLRRALHDNRYRGWQDGVLYRDEVTSEYRIDIRQGDSLRMYRFDTDGNPLEKKDGPKKDHDL